jgi:putative nucleotidyltransferase with HDIG domain
MEEINSAEKQRIFCHHQIEHLLDVARIMYINALENHLNINKEIIYATALLHDIGRAKAYKQGTDHAVESVNTAKEILTECDFPKEETEAILLAIAHHNDNAKADKLCTLLRQADKISRNCFMCNAFDECNWSTEKKNKGVTV